MERHLLRLARMCIGYKSQARASEPTKPPWWSSWVITSVVVVGGVVAAAARLQLCNYEISARISRMSRDGHLDSWPIRAKPTWPTIGRRAEQVVADLLCFALGCFAPLARRVLSPPDRLQSRTRIWLSLGVTWRAIKCRAGQCFLAAIH